MGQLEDILKHQNMVRNNIMKSFGAETSEDSLEKSFEDEVNPFEMEAYKSELTKAELDEFEKAKHNDGDMHPNGKWVWRQSANGGKGDWRVAKTGGSKATVGGAAAATNKTNASTNRSEKVEFSFKGNEINHADFIGNSRGKKIQSKYSNREEDAYEIRWHNPKTNKTTVKKYFKEDYDRLLNQAKNNKGPYFIKTTSKKTAEKSSYESKEADAYDKGDGKVGNYPVPTHTSYPAANLYSRLKNNRHFGFKYGLPEEEIMKKLKDYKGNVKVSYHNNAGTSEIYRIKFL